MVALKPAERMISEPSRRAVFACTLCRGPSLTGYAQPGKVRRILLYATTPQPKTWFIAGMRDLGWIEGQNISVQLRSEIDEQALRSGCDRNQPVDVLVLRGRIQAALQDEHRSDRRDRPEPDPVAAGSRRASRSRVQT